MKTSVRADAAPADARAREDAPATLLTSGTRQGRGRWLGAGLLGLLLVAGTSAGTWAAFSASTTSAGTFGTGTVVLEHTVVARDGVALVAPAACDSSDGGDVSTNAATCTALFSPDPRRLALGEGATAVVVLENVGSLDAPTFQVHADGPCAATTEQSFSGTGDLCQAMTIEIVELTGDGCDATTGTGCTDAVRHAEEPLSEFGESHGTFDEAIFLGALPDSEPRAFRVSMQLPDIETDPNRYQGLRATVGVTWRITS